MLSFPAAIKVYLCTVACDMRRSFDGLSMMAEHIIRCNPFSGHLLVFVSVRRTHVGADACTVEGWVWVQALLAARAASQWSGRNSSSRFCG
jgi:hypothetical protein